MHKVYAAASAQDPTGSHDHSNKTALAKTAKITTTRTTSVVDSSFYISNSLVRFKAFQQPLLNRFKSIAMPRCIAGVAAQVSRKESAQCCHLEANASWNDALSSMGRTRSNGTSNFNTVEKDADLRAFMIPDVFQCAHAYVYLDAHVCTYTISICLDVNRCDR